MNQYFNRSEFACKCGCGMDAVDTELLAVLTRLREHFGKPITINSANRCAARNKAVGGSDKSQHLLSKAADIAVKDVKSRQVFDLLGRWYPDKFGLGSYATFTHIDVRAIKARW